MPVTSILAILPLLAPLWLAASVPTFFAEDGIVVAEVESHPPVRGWVPETELAGFTGAGYYHDHGGARDLTYRIIIVTPGRYHFRLRNRHEHPDNTLENDCWTEMDDGGKVKTFSPRRGEWNWKTYHELHGGDKPPASYELSAGEHILRISGRSSGFRIDRFVLFRDGISEREAIDSDRPETRGFPPPPHPAHNEGLVARWRAGALGSALALAERLRDNERATAEERAEAERAVAVLGAHAQTLRQRAESLKAQHPVGALLVLEYAAEAYRGHDLGDPLRELAREWPREEGMRDALAAADLLRRIRVAAAELPEPGSRRYQREVARIRQGLQTLLERFPDAPAAAQAQELLDRHPPP